MNAHPSSAVQYRFARPTNQLAKVVQFYVEGLGLPEIGRFEDHAGYDGVMVGLPGSHAHLEFTQHCEAQLLPSPTAEHLLVQYFDSPEAYAQANARIQQFGASPVEPENPYWIGKSETYADPDGYRVVLFDGVFEP